MSRAKSRGNEGLRGHCLPDDGLLATPYVSQDEQPTGATAGQAESGAHVCSVIDVIAAERDISQVKRYWRVFVGEPKTRSWDLCCELRVEAAEEQTGLAAEPTAITQSWPRRAERTLAAAPFRGTVTFGPRHRVLFSGKAVFSPGQLPRRKPHVFVENRLLVDQENE